jgi:hypothetical protein
MLVVPDETDALVVHAVGSLRAEGHERWVHVTDDHAAARPHDPAQLGDARTQLGEMRQRERAHGEVGLLVLERQRRQRADSEVRARDARQRQGEHRLRLVDADHVVPQLDEPSRVATGAAGGV